MKLPYLLLSTIALVLPLYNCSNKPIKVIIMAGQSNMEGHDALFDPSLPQGLTEDAYNTYRTDNSNVKINYDCTYEQREGIGDGNSSNGEFVKVDFGQGRDKNHFGPEVGFAHYLGEHDRGQNYYLIKVAEGSSDLYEQWQKDGRCYTNLVKDVDASIKKLESAHFSFQITGFIWMQGEADAQREDRASAYENKMNTLLDNLTTKYGKYCVSSGLIVADGGIYDKHEEGYRAAAINEAKQAIAEKRKHYHYVADSVTIPLSGPWHYTNTGYLKLGEAFAKAYLAG
ncbi:MAG: sialate O-acetylesterase [Bacilli bacterium]|nr:sialate O-acetylesterase [Bacilli bacterium]